jgi:lysophospholipase L1-like esterase
VLSTTVCTFKPLMTPHSTRHLLHAVAAWLLACGCAHALAQPLKILCVGDSVTQGGGDPGREEYSYRVPLKKLLTALDVPTTFIGTRHGGLVPEASGPDGFDGPHEGYYGKRTAYVAARVEENLDRLPQPDIVLVQLGTNDLDTWDPHESIIAPLRQMIARLRQHNPRVAVVVSPPNFNSVKVRWIALLEARMAEQLSTVSSPVITVGPPATWDASTDTFDGAHPTPTGQMKMAANWVGAMSPWILRRDERMALRP